MLITLVRQVHLMGWWFWNPELLQPPRHDHSAGWFIWTPRCLNNCCRWENCLRTIFRLLPCCSPVASPSWRWHLETPIRDLNTLWQETWVSGTLASQWHGPEQIYSWSGKLSEQGLEQKGKCERWRKWSHSVKGFYNGDGRPLRKWALYTSSWNETIHFELGQTANTPRTRAQHLQLAAVRGLLSNSLSNQWFSQLVLCCQQQSKFLWTTHKAFPLSLKP